MRGLWYFFGIVIAAGIFSGVCGLGLGYIGGVLWEQFHRHRRQERLKVKALAEANPGSSGASPAAASEFSAPQLKLVSVDSIDLPDLGGRILTSVRFNARGIQLDLSGVRLDITGNALMILGTQRIRFPEPGSHDALCSLIGERIESVRAPSPERIEMHFASGSALVVSRNAVAVA